MTSRTGLPEANPAAHIRHPSKWKTGDEPITAAQRSDIGTLATQVGETVDNLDGLTKADASLRIEELQENTRRHADQVVRKA